MNTLKQTTLHAFPSRRLRQGAAAAAVLALGTWAAGTAQAQALVSARVLHATPVWQQVPVSDCPNPGAVRPSGPGTALGALVGGLLGSRVGGGDGRIVSAIAGTVGGAFIGNQLETGGARCGTRYENRVTGYDVSYEYAGRQYRTQTPYQPGAYIQVQAPVAGYDNGYDSNAYQGAQTYPVTPTYVAPSYGDGAVAAQPVYGTPVYGTPVYSAPAYAAPVYTQPAPVYVAPAYASPVSLSLSLGGIIGGGRHHGPRHW